MNGTKVVEIRGSLEARVLVMERLLEDMGKVVKDHESRVRWIERVVMYGIGAAGLGSFVLDHLK